MRSEINDGAFAIRARFSPPNPHAHAWNRVRKCSLLFFGARSAATNNDAFIQPPVHFSPRRESAQWRCSGGLFNCWMYVWHTIGAIKMNNGRPEWKNKNTSANTGPASKMRISFSAGAESGGHAPGSNFKAPLFIELMPRTKIMHTASTKSLCRCAVRQARFVCCDPPRRYISQF